MAIKQRLRFVQDDSAHWYAIPADEHSRELFDIWVSSFDYENEDKEYRGPDFEQDRLDGGPSRFTFTDLRRDK